MCVGERAERATSLSVREERKREGGEGGRKREGRKRGSHGRMGAPTGRVWLYTREAFQETLMTFWYNIVPIDTNYSIIQCKHNKAVILNSPCLY